MKATPEAGHKTLDELETHLRETLAPLLRSGMNETEAFQRAVAQLGSAAALAAEFQKLNQAAWLPARVVSALGIGAALLLALGLATFFHNPKWSLLLVVHIFTVTLGYTTALLTGTLGICFVCQRSYSTFPALRRQQIVRVTFIFGGVATGLTATGTVLGMFWARNHLGRWWAWDPKETSAFCALLWMTFFLLAHRWRGINTRAVLLLSIVGNVMVMLAWFGPFLLPGKFHIEAPSFASILVTFIMIHLAFVLAGLAPAGWLRTNRA